MSAIQSLLHHMGSGSAEWQGNSTASMTESSTSIDEGKGFPGRVIQTYQLQKKFYWSLQGSFYINY